MKTVALLAAFVMVFSLVLSTPPSYSKSMTLPNGDVYESACERIKVGTDIYYWAAASERMLYVGRVVKLQRIEKKTIVWIKRANSNRFEPKLQKSICTWGWVKVKEGSK